MNFETSLNKALGIIGMSDRKIFLESTKQPICKMLLEVTDYGELQHFYDEIKQLLGAYPTISIIRTAAELLRNMSTIDEISIYDYRTAIRRATSILRDEALHRIENINPNRDELLNIINTDIEYILSNIDETIPAVKAQLQSISQS